VLLVVEAVTERDMGSAIRGAGGRGDDDDRRSSECDERLHRDPRISGILKMDGCSPRLRLREELSTKVSPAENRQ
jgi:hypothetical protein